MKFANDLTKLAIRVQAVREGGAVRRGHAFPSNTKYSVAEHSFNAVNLLLMIHPNPPIELIKTLMWHDVPERWLGDIPALAKLDNVGLKVILESAENEILSGLGLSQKSVLTQDDLAWVKHLDVLELWFWCREEEALGNGNVIEWKSNCELLLSQSTTIPDPVRVFFEYERHRAYRRLSDRFPHVKMDYLFS